MFTQTKPKVNPIPEFFGSYEIKTFFAADRLLKIDFVKTNFPKLISQIRASDLLIS